ncbi:hypothetical protein niasHT_004753 [Heterodera trifolii]|uniref:Gamma-tubulin complex component n=1 Tax=Heterodera trifolii TaxID=157864 RepID=A0ABD2MCR4_9BILA
MIGQILRWKSQRIMILEYIIRDNFLDYDVPSLPTNAVRPHQRKQFTDLPFDQQEKALFEDFLSVCRGINGPFIQCEQFDNNEIIWVWTAENWKQRTDNQNIERWMNVCFGMGTILFDLLLCIGQLRADSTRGPTVYAFCSLVLKHLERKVYAELHELDKLEVKNLMTLRNVCNELRHRHLLPLLTIAREILLADKVGGELINFLFDQKERTECYHIVSLLDEIISVTLLRYNQTVFEWISQCSLSLDMGHEFFIWDLRKQSIVKRSDFISPALDNFGFDHTYVSIPELLPKVYESVADELLNLGRFLFTMKNQNADIEHLSIHYELDQNLFKNKTLREFCAAIHSFYGKCSTNILDHFKKRFNILQFARHLPHFFVGLNSAWIYEFVVLLETTGLSDPILDNDFEMDDNDRFIVNTQLQLLLQEAFRVSWLQNSPFHDKICVSLMRLSPTSDDRLAEHEKRLEHRLKNPPKLELNIVVPKDNASNKNKDLALSLAFPPVVVWSYRQMFYHLLLLNRAKHWMYRKYFALKGTNCRREEFATVHQFLRVLNVYIEYLCGIASAAYPNFSKQLDSMKYTHQLMGQMMLDQGFKQLKELLVQLATKFCEYARDSIDFHTLNREASPLVGEIKKILLQNRDGGPTGLRDILFGCYFTAIGGTAADEEPIWRLLCHVDDEIAFAAAFNG